MTGDYAAFLAGKAPIPSKSGLRALPPLAAHLFQHQRECVGFALLSGAAGCYIDTGLGKTAIELEFCAHAAAATNGFALILAPLAVATQIAREGRRFGYDSRVIRSQSDAAPGINVCNYDRIDKLD
ncbi:MAG: hypothetical protein ACM3II_13780, partial [Rhodospirillaceae bacterium]